MARCGTVWSSSTRAPGWTSHDVVAKLRGVYGQKRVGHAGTLDPDATGVLLVGLGRVTRLLRYLQEAGKEYRGRVVFGVATDTLDAAGSVLERAEMVFTRADLERASGAFVGDIEQVPPMVSALKVGGRRLYEMARAGEEIERAARPVHIGELVVEDFEPGAYPEATIRGRVFDRHLYPHARGRSRRPRSVVARTSGRCAGCGSGASRSPRRARSRRSRPTPTRPCSRRPRRCAISNASASTPSGRGRLRTAQRSRRPR